MLPKSDLQKHIKSVHDGEIYPCTQCDYKAKQNRCLQTHLKSVHKGQAFQCNQCEYKATQKTNLKNHKKSVHEGQTFPCTAPYVDTKQHRTEVFNIT